jgi:hypothetical protein
LDALVAEKVMGLTVNWASEQNPVFPGGDWNNKLTDGPYCPPGCWPVKHYSRDIAAAWQVKAEMIRRGWIFEMTVSDNGIAKVWFSNMHAVGGMCAVDAKSEADEARCIVSAAIDALRNAGEVE